MFQKQAASDRELLAKPQMKLTRRGSVDNIMAGALAFFAGGEGGDSEERASPTIEGEANNNKKASGREGATSPVHRKRSFLMNMMQGGSSSPVPTGDGGTVVTAEESLPKHRKRR